MDMLEEIRATLARGGTAYHSYLNHEQVLWLIGEVERLRHIEHAARYLRQLAVDRWPASGYTIKFAVEDLDRALGGTPAPTPLDRIIKPERGVEAGHEPPS